MVAISRKIAGLGIEVSSARCWKGNNWFDMEITHEKSSHGRLRGHNPSCIVERVDGVIAVDNALSVK